jgi:hypothetical protein
MTAAERIAAALVNKEKGWRGSTPTERHLVQLFAADILECCGAVKSPSEIVLALQKGSTPFKDKIEHEVAIYADDAHHLLEQLGG